MKKVLLLAVAAVTSVLIYFRTQVPSLEAPFLVDQRQLRNQFVDRNGVPLSRTFENDWNIFERKSLSEIPNLLKEAFILSEDKRFRQHFGTDPIAIAHAVASNLKALRVIRGGSSITEQVVRLLKPRSRNLWSRLLEAIEAVGLETKYSKEEIFEFYLNQIPLEGKARGVYGASLSLFDRDLSSISKKESLALAVLARSPGKFSPRTKKGTALLEKRISDLGERLAAKGIISLKELEELKESKLSVAKRSMTVDAGHFLRHINNLPELRGAGIVMTSLNGAIQNAAKEILSTRIKELSPYAVNNGAILAVNNATMEILLWINSSSKVSGTESIDSVTTPRQPGSTLKPFLYAKALEKGWTAATVIDDSPMLRGVGAGLKEYKNFSRTYYGPVRLRMALGNSLNIPAIKTIEFVGRGEFLSLLKELGFNSLGKDPDFYGDGLALGNGEVTLYELVRAYSVLARGGLEASFRPTLDEPRKDHSLKRIIRKDISSLIGDILSDPEARALEFGRGGLFAFPSETAVKTGTSSDFNDAWAIGYTRNHTVGVWLGNLNREPMREVSGAKGAVLILRSVLSLLETNRDRSPLYRDPTLVKKPICSDKGSECFGIQEIFAAGTNPNEATKEVSINPCEASLEVPTQGLHVAFDPRIPDSLEALPLSLMKDVSPKTTKWYVDEKLVGETGEGETKSIWKLTPGRHVARAEVEIGGCGSRATTNEVAFYVR